MDVPFRVAVALFVICAPTVLFLGLWHGLTALRDDDLASEVTARQLRGVFDVLPSGQPDAGRFERVEIPDGGTRAAIGGRSGRAESTPEKAAESRFPGVTIEDVEKTEIGIGVETDPIECSRCTEPNPPAAELCWGCGAYLSSIEDET